MAYQISGADYVQSAYSFPSDNNLDIPVLLLEMAAPAVVSPMVPWGYQSVKKRQNGGCHFYVSDPRFEPLWRDPQKLINAKPQMFVETNFTISWDAPRAVALYQIYRKRVLTRIWQQAGLKAIVDLFVPERAIDLALIGVPPGWPSYAIRGDFYNEQPRRLLRYWQLAQDHSALSNPLFVVYSGNANIEELCRKHSWLYYPQFKNFEAIAG